MFRKKPNTSMYSDVREYEWRGINVYRNNGFWRISFGAFFMLGAHWPYMNYFKDCRRKGIEIFFGVSRRLSFLGFLDLHIALWRRAEKPRVRIHNHPMYPDGHLIFSFLWFGLMIRCPRFIIRWKKRRAEREMERMQEEYDKAFPPSPEEQAYYDKLSQDDEPCSWPSECKDME